jgi:hypothetical protein
MNDGLPVRHVTPPTPALQAKDCSSSHKVSVFTQDIYCVTFSQPRRTIHCIQHEMNIAVMLKVSQTAHSEACISYIALFHSVSL